MTDDERTPDWDGGTPTARTNPYVCYCWAYPAMHDAAGVCVNWERHDSKPCGHETEAAR